MLLVHSLLRQRFADLRVVLALVPALLWNMAIFLIYTYLSPLLRLDLHLTDISALLLIFGLGAVYRLFAFVLSFRTQVASCARCGE